MSDVYALVRSIRANRLPRNRHFAEHETRRGAEARKLHRFLRAIERDLLAADAVQVYRQLDGMTVTMAFPNVRLTRVVALRPAEFALLLEDERLAARLSAPDP